MSRNLPDTAAEAPPRSGPTDPLASVADLNAVQTHLALAISASQPGLELIDIRRDDIRYVPNIEASVLFKLWFRSTGSRRASQSAVLYLPVNGHRPQPPSPHQIALYQKLDGKVLLNHSIEVAALDAVLTPMPIDLRLSRLIDALDPTGIKEWLNLERARDDDRITRVKPQLISHTLGSRATIRYDLTLRGSSGTETRGIVIGKLNAARPLAPLIAANHALYRETHSLIGQARPVGMIQSLGLSLQSFAGSTRLTDVLDSDEVPGWLSDVGRQLAHLHNTRIPTDTKRDAGRELRSLQRRCDLLADVLPDSGRVNRLCKLLRREIKARMRITGLVHGDFHHANIMVDTDGVRIIDFDEMGLGDPHLDIARFMVSLSMPSLRFFDDLRLCDLARKTYLQTYTDLRATDPGSLCAFEAAAWLASAATAFRLHRPGWQAHVEQMIQSAERALTAAQGPVPEIGPAMRTAVPDAGIEGWLEDTDYMKLRLKPGVAENFGAELTQLDVSKSNRNRRLHKTTYRAKGVTETGEWSGKLHVMAGRGLAPAALTAALTYLRHARAADPDIMAVPNPVAHVPSLLLLAYEALVGSSGTALLRRGANPDHASALGRAIAAFQDVDTDKIALPQTHSCEDVLRALRRRAARRATNLEPFDTLAEGLVASSEIFPSPGLRKLSQVIFGKDGPSTSVPEVLALEPGEAAPAHLLWELRPSPAIAEAFRAAYLDRSGRRGESLAQWTVLVGIADGSSA